MDSDRSETFGVSAGAAWQRLVQTDYFAHIERTSPIRQKSSQIVAVASINNRMLTSSFSVKVARLLTAISSVPTVLVDADGESQPLRRQLGQQGEGNLAALAEKAHSDLKRDVIRDFADCSGLIPLISMDPEESLRITPEMLHTVVRRAQHCWPTVIIDLPYTCAPETIAMGTALADHTVLVTDAHHKGHSWLYNQGHHLTTAANEGRVTVAMVGAPLNSSLPEDTVPFPLVDGPLPKDVSALSMYHRLLARLGTSNTPIET